MAKKITWILFCVLCIAIGLYPIIYFVMERTFGLLASKSPELLSNQLWNIGFYGHIIFGGISLLTGWSQFSNKIRLQNVRVHRTLGLIYCIAVLISGICGVGIGTKATGGIISSTGFILLGLIWLSTTVLAFTSIKKGRIDAHQHFMIYSYACCFAAVTLRIWLPLLTMMTGEFIPAYRIVAWLCWVPNLLVAAYIVNRLKSKPQLVNQPDIN